MLTELSPSGDAASWRRIGWMILVWLAMAACCLGEAAEGYRIVGRVVAGGGGTSTGGVYSVSGTIGQAEAGPAMTGASYAVVGGFWGGITLVQVPGAPRLTIVHAGAEAAKVSWPHPSAGWVLQEKGALDAAPWVDSLLPVTVEGANQSVTVRPEGGNVFFRLFRAGGF